MKSLEELKAIVEGALAKYWRDPNSSKTHLVEDLRRIIALEEENKKLRDMCLCYETQTNQLQGEYGDIDQIKAESVREAANYLESQTCTSKTDFELLNAYANNLEGVSDE